MGDISRCRLREGSGARTIVFLNDEHSKKSADFYACLGKLLKNVYENFTEHSKPRRCIYLTLTREAMRKVLRRLSL
jgi:hypothetical protein